MLGKRSKAKPKLREMAKSVLCTVSTQPDVEKGGLEGNKRVHMDGGSGKPPLLGVENGKPSTNSCTSKEAMAGVLYCSVSLAMVLLNKAVLSSFQFRSSNSLLFFQCIMSVGLISALRGLNWVPKDPLDMRVVKIWWPANALFVAMIWSSFYSIKYLSVPMVTILKNSTNFLVILGDWVIFRKRYGLGVWSTVWLILIASLMGGITDLSFSWYGYCWQALNCAVTAMYSLYLKMVMERVSAITGKPKGLEQSTMVLYNNLLALPWVLSVMYVLGETETVWQEPDLRNPVFLIAAVASGFAAFSISFASLFYLSQTTATTYSLTGSVNKVPMAVLGMLFFATPVTTPNLLSLGIGLTAGVLFVFAKAHSAG